MFVKFLLLNAGDSSLLTKPTLYNMKHALGKFLIKSLHCPSAKNLEAVLIANSQVAVHKQNQQEEFASYWLKHLQFGSGSILPNMFVHVMLWREETP